MIRQELPSFLEDHISQISALQLLQSLGWQYLTPAEAVKLRSGKLSNVLLGEVLVEQLRDDEIPKLFLYSQLLLAISKNEGMYGTIGTAAKFWAIWKEEVDPALAKCVRTPLSAEQKDRLFGDLSQTVREFFDGLERKPRDITLSPVEPPYCGLDGVCGVRIGIPGDVDQLVADDDSGGAAESLELPRQVPVNRLAERGRPDSAGFGRKQRCVEVLR